MKNADNFYMRIAIDVAGLSKCQKRGVGAIAVKGHSIIDFGYNGRPYGSQDETCEFPNGITRDDVVHAEENVVAKCAKEGKSIKGATIYVTYAPCMRCARLLYQCGIKRVVFLEGNSYGGIETMEDLGIKVDQWAMAVTKV